MPQVKGGGGEGKRKEQQRRKEEDDDAPSPAPSAACGKERFSFLSGELAAETTGGGTDVRSYLRRSLNICDTSLPSAAQDEREKDYTHIFGENC